MKHAIITCVNGSFKIEAEGYTSLDSAKVYFAGKWQALLNAPDVITGAIMIVNENFECVEGYKEFISHPVNESETT
jgi:hypothetical protein